MDVYKSPVGRRKLKFKDIHVKFTLDPSNGLGRLSDLVPWEELELLSDYRNRFGSTGNPAQRTEPRKPPARRGEARRAKTGGKERRGEEERSRRQVRRREAKYGLNRIRGKLPETSASIIILQFIIMNLWRMHRDILSFFSGERPKSRFGHVVRDSYPQTVHFDFSEARLATCSRSFNYSRAHIKTQEELPNMQKNLPK